jgi:hypothetical protein
LQPIDAANHFPSFLVNRRAEDRRGWFQFRDIADHNGFIPESERKGSEQSGCRSITVQVAELRPVDRCTMVEGMLDRRIA